MKNNIQIDQVLRSKIEEVVSPSGNDGAITIIMEITQREIEYKERNYTTQFGLRRDTRSL